MPVNPTESLIKDLLKRFTSLSNRITQLETTEPHQQIGAVHASSFILNGTAIAAGAFVSSYGIAGANSVPANASGIFMQVTAAFAGASELRIAADDQSPDQYSGRLVATAASTQSGLILVKLSAVGGIRFLNSGASNITACYAAVTGWFR